MFARTYCPSEVPRIVEQWKADLATTNQKAADALASPAEYANLFPLHTESLEAEAWSK